MTHTAIFNRYFQDLTEAARRGDAREESFYPSLKGLMEQVAHAAGRSDMHVTTLPVRTDAGNPDFRIWNGVDRIIGYIEAKNTTEDNLDRIEGSEQLRRYRNTFPNLILTNFLEFRLYRNGERVDTVLAARPRILNELRHAPPIEKPNELRALLERFLDFSLPRAYTAEALAVDLAKRTRFLRDVVRHLVEQEAAAGQGSLSEFYEAFRKFLIGDLTREGFADLYAQTVTYGLFAARTRSNNGFGRRAAFDRIPRTLGVLRDLFRFISLGDLPAELEWTVDDIAQVLAVADAPGILSGYYREGKGSDPIVHFYETFLARYDPQERERRGVYYTPEPVVSYIVRSLHSLLKTEFGKPDGLASDGVTLLDPAAGTMTFVARAAQEAVREFEAKYGSGGRDQFIRNHILPNYCALELMMAPYAVGHLKMSFFLEELGHRLTDDDRVRFYLTNSLDTEELEQSRFPGLSSLSEESRLAGQVKKEARILVILGNPPYSGHSVNKGEWILRQIDEYKKVDGKPLGEKNPKWLQDDYVKFLRFAQWKIEQNGQGVVGMITNHSYLDNPTFRGMRQSLMRTFDEIYVLDLHGNSLKREVCPDGSKDKNVFDIRQGVAIAFFIKNGKRGGGPAAVRHAERWGLREEKYEWLGAHDVGSTEWRGIAPRSEFYFFVPRNESTAGAYDTFVKVTEAFPVSSVGIVTSRDGFVLDFERDALERRIRQFRDPAMTDSLLTQAYGLKEKDGWGLAQARSAVRGDQAWGDKLVRCLYRPFDVRWLFYHQAVIERGREDVMRHMLAGENVALITARSNKSPTMDHFFCSECVVETKCGESTVQSYTFPLYLYPNTERRDLFSALEPQERRPNLNEKVVAALAQAYGREPVPEEVFGYIYAVLYSETYRQRYAEHLRIDFPRVPFTADADVFGTLAALGERLVGLHLLRAPELDPPFARFEGAGDSAIGRPGAQGLRYDAGQERVCINPTQYFAPVPAPVWEYRIGGYQVCHKWLKDRRERRLGLDEIRTYCWIVTALQRTIELQREIDSVYPRVEGSLLNLHLG